MRVKEFKEKSEKVKSMMGHESYEVMNDELRKDEKKLGVSILFRVYFRRTSSKNKKRFFL